MSLEHDANGNLFSTSCRLRIYAGSLYVFWLVDLPALRCAYYYISLFVFEEQFTVGSSQYNILLFLGKKAIMLVYTGHGVWLWKKRGNFCYWLNIFESYRKGFFSISGACERFQHGRQTRRLTLLCVHNFFSVALAFPLSPDVIVETSQGENRKTMQKEEPKNAQVSLG